MTFKEYIQGDPIEDDITSLNLNELNLTDIYGIEEYKNIKYLFISWNEIRDITPLKYLLKINTLDISKNLIDNLDVLIYLDNLDTLWVYDNPIIKNNLLKCVGDKRMLVDSTLIEFKNTIKSERRKKIINLLNE